MEQRRRARDMTVNSDKKCRGADAETRALQGPSSSKTLTRELGSMPQVSRMNGESGVPAMPGDELHRAPRVQKKGLHASKLITARDMIRLSGAEDDVPAVGCKSSRL